MVRICDKCGFINQDEYDFCAKCGNQLVDNVGYQQMGVPQVSEKSKRKVILVCYLISIFLSWGGVFLYFLKTTEAIGFFGFFGAFIPFFLIQAPDRKAKIHGCIMLIIALTGIAVSFYLLLYR